MPYLNLAMKTKKSSEAGSGCPMIRLIEARPRRLFAFGDIHGCAQELEVLIEYLIAARKVDGEDLLIFIGDYIDRGPDSRRVVDYLLEVRRMWPNTVFLRGNHEEMLLDYLALGGSGGEFYLKNGGIDFFASYGISPVGPLSEIRSAIPVEHLEFFQNLEFGVSLAEFMFVHAGISPNKPLIQQSREDLLWIREEFIKSPHQLGKTVVFGHTAFNQVLVDLPYKIGIDTGAVYGNRLSAVELVNGGLFQVEVGDRSVKELSLKNLLASGS